jgi:LuxR family maltose regulon positive regulatory protein
MQGADTLAFRARLSADQAALLRWITTVPDEVFLTHAPLTFDLAHASFWFTHSANVARLYDLAERTVRRLGDEDRLAEIAGLRANQAFRRGDYRSMLAYALEGQRKFTSPGPNQRARLYVSAHLAYAGLGQVGEAGGALTAAESAIEPIRDQAPAMARLLAAYEGRLSYLRGHLRRAHAQLGDLIAQFRDVPDLEIPGAYAYAGAVAYEWNDLAEAQRLSERALGTGSGKERALNWLMVPLLRARVLWAIGQNADATQTLDEALAYARAGRNVAWIAAIQSQLASFCLAEGDLDGPEARMIALPGAGGPPRYEDLPVHLAGARLAIARARVGASAAGLPAALDTLTHLEAEAAVQGRLGDRVACLALLARGHQAAGARDLAQAALAEALRLAEPEGFVRSFLDEGPAMDNLLRAAGGPAAAYAHHLRAASAATPGRRAARARAGRGPVALSERERAVLHLLAEGRSIDKVAEYLVISAHTARSYVRGLYTKLGAVNRLQAIENARRRRLL